MNYPIPPVGALEAPAEWDQFRQQCPVARVRLPSGDEAALLTRYDDVRQVLADPRFGRGTDAPDAARVSDSESGGVFNSDMAMARVLRRCLAGRDDGGLQYGVCQPRSGQVRGR